MKTIKRGQEKTRRMIKHEKLKHETQPTIAVEMIPAPTIFWHPAVSLEKLISGFSEYQDSIIVS